MKIHGVYDGIEEEDNHLPNWWLATLFGAMVFAFGYWFFFHSTHAFASTREVYEEQVAEAKKRDALQNPVSNESLMALAGSATALDDGKKTFSTICIACHGPSGGGTVGPNLTDRYWLHGSHPEDLYKDVMGGFPDKGMPPWGKSLGPERTRNVIAFVLSIRNTNVPGGKAPQGDPEN
jgi:cytochrome c oxidase cbb3-type subunit III